MNKISIFVIIFIVADNLSSTYAASTYFYVCSFEMDGPYEEELGDPLSEKFKRKATALQTRPTTVLRGQASDPNLRLVFTSFREGNGGRIIADFHILTSNSVVVPGLNTIVGLAFTAGGIAFRDISVSDQNTYTPSPVPSTPPENTPGIEVHYRMILDEPFNAAYGDTSSADYRTKTNDLLIKLTMGFKITNRVELIAMEIKRLFSGSLGVEFSTFVKRSEKSETEDSAKITAGVACILGNVNNVNSITVSSLSVQTISPSITRTITSPTRPTTTPTTTSPSSTTNRTTIFIVVGVLGGILVVTELILGFLYFWKDRQKNKIGQNAM